MTAISSSSSKVGDGFTVVAEASTGEVINCSAKALTLCLSSLARFQSWSKLRLLDEVSFGHGFVKMLIVVNQTFLKSVFVHFIKLSFSTQLGKRLIPQDLGGPCSGSTSITNLFSLTGLVRTCCFRLWSWISNIFYPNLLPLQTNLPVRWWDSWTNGSKLGSMVPNLVPMVPMVPMVPN